MTGYESKRAAAQDKLDSMERKALKLALETFESMNIDLIFEGEFDGEIAVIKEALAQKQEPVAWLHAVNKTCVTTDPTAYARGIPLYAAPPQRPWVELTAEEILDLFDATNVYGSKWIEFARAVEIKIKEKNA